MDREYVVHASRAVGLALDEARTESVTAHLGRIEEIASKLDAIDLDPVADEPAPVWRP